MIRVFMADDHPIVRAGLRALLSLAPDITLVGEVGDGRKVLLAMEEPDWAVDVLLLDLSLPRVGGLEVLRRVRARHPDLAVLVLSMYDEEQYADRLLAQGAAGYVSKDRSEEELIAAVRAVARGRVYVSRSVALARLDHPGPPSAPHERLTPREHQVFTLLFDGRTVTDIAAELDLSVSTVSTHVGNIKGKLAVSSVAEIVSYAHRMGLTE
ncbi:MAG: response regulator transcription factor [Alphaproteobacteria bacterium]|nr:response regulator transcription factor [Alphaproteobacteria bacterium]